MRGERYPRIAVQLPDGEDPNQLAHTIMQRIPDSDLRQMQAGSALMFFPAISRGSLGELFATHPSLEHRIARLQAMEAQLSR